MTLKQLAGLLDYFLNHTIRDAHILSHAVLILSNYFFTVRAADKINNFNISLKLVLDIDLKIYKKQS